LIRALTSGRDAVGARITVTSGGRKQVDEVRSGGSFISQNDFRAHFGLGRASATDVSIRWPDGKIDHLAGVGANQIVTVEQGKGITRRQPFSSTKK